MLKEVGSVTLVRNRERKGNLRHSVAQSPPETQSPDNESCNRNIITLSQCTDTHTRKEQGNRGNMVVEGEGEGKTGERLPSLCLCLCVCHGVCVCVCVYERGEGAERERERERELR